jgi:hypothetical protein
VPEVDPASLAAVDAAAWLTSREVAAALEASLRTAQRLAPELGARKVGGRWLIPAAAVADLASERRTRSTN